jgi:hypothetical protein
MTRRNAVVTGIGVVAPGGVGRGAFWDRLLSGEDVLPGFFNRFEHALDGPVAGGSAADPTVLPSPPANLPWVQPYPDRLLEQITAPEEEPGAVVVARETIELTFLAVIQASSDMTRISMAPPLDIAGGLFRTGEEHDQFPSGNCGRPTSASKPAKRPRTSTGREFFTAWGHWQWR